MSETHSHNHDGPRPQNPTVVHYHYHYYCSAPADHAPTHHAAHTIHSQTHRPHACSNNQETKSNSSHHSWKRLLKPELQSTLPTALRSSNSASFLQKSMLLQETSPRSSLRGTVSRFALQTPNPLDRKERSISSRLPLAETSFQNTLPSLPSAHEWSPRVHTPDLPKNRFSKKTEVQISSASRLRELSQFEHQQTQQAYRQRLIEEECQYLREQFLLHLQGAHGLH